MKNQELRFQNKYTYTKRDGVKFTDPCITEQGIDTSVQTMINRLENGMTVNQHNIEFYDVDFDDITPLDIERMDLAERESLAIQIEDSIKKAEEALSKIKNKGKIKPSDEPKDPEKGKGLSEEENGLEAK